MPSTKRRSRKSSKDTGEGKEGSALGSEEPVSKGKGRGRKPSVKAKAGKWHTARPGVERILAQFPTVLPTLELLLGAGFG